MKNEYKVTKKRMLAWAKEYHLYGSTNIVLFVFWSIAAVCGLFGFVLYLTLKENAFSICFSALLFLIAIYKLFFTRFVVWAKRYKLLSKTYGVSEWMRVTEFSDLEIVLTDHTSVMKYGYDQITQIKEKDNMVIIFFNNHTATRIYKDAFIEGSWDECKEMIRSRTRN